MKLLVLVGIIPIVFGTPDQYMARCESIEDCDAGFRMICKNNRCACKTGELFFEWPKFGCFVKAHMFEKCEVSGQCMAMNTNTYCNPENGTCICSPNYFFNGHECRVRSPYRDPMINEGLFEGDIMGIDPYADRSAVLKDSQRWPEGIVPYIISPEREDIKELILKAMRYLESYTCIRFVERTTEKDYIKIKKDNGCWSLWGRGEGGEQPLSLGVGCEYFATIVHELIHALGFEHEHNRPDRDDYLIIHWDHIADSQKHNFEKLRPDETRLLTQFDMRSIMLYGSHAFTTYYKNLTMTYKDGRKIEDIPNRESMSVLDAEKINILYNCEKKKQE